MHTSFYHALNSLSLFVCLAGQFDFKLIKERKIDFCSASLSWCTFHFPYVQPFLLLPSFLPFSSLLLIFPIFWPISYIFLLYLQNLQCCLPSRLTIRPPCHLQLPSSHHVPLTLQTSVLGSFCFNPRDYYPWLNRTFEKDQRQ